MQNYITNNYVSINKKQFFIAVAAILLSIIMATNAPIKAYAVNAKLEQSIANLKTQINATIDSTIVSIDENKQQITSLENELKAMSANGDVDAPCVVEACTREDVSAWLQQVREYKSKANEIITLRVEAFELQLKNAGASQLKVTVEIVEKVIKLGDALVESAKKSLEKSKEKLQQITDKLKEKASKMNEKFKALIEKIADVINQIIVSITELLKQARGYLELVVNVVSISVEEKSKRALEIVKGLIAVGKKIVETSKEAIKDVMRIIKEKIQADIQAIKNAFKSKKNGVEGETDANIAEGTVAYKDIAISPKVTDNLKTSNEDTKAELKKLKQEIEKDKDASSVKVKIQTVIKKINEAKIAKVHAHTTKAVNSQIAVADSLQVSANALQVQINQLKQCLRESKSDGVCANLRLDQNNADQGAFLEESIVKIRSNIDTVRAFLGASVDIISLLKEGNYKGTIESLTSMTEMMSSITSLTKGLKNDLNNLSNAVNV